MKNFKYLMVLFMSVSLLTVSCSDDDDNDSGNEVHPLVGTWAFSGTEEGISISMEMTFNANGTGIMTTSATFNGITESDSENFNWSTSGNTLTIFDEDGTYTIVGNVLTITSDGQVLILTRV